MGATLRTISLSSDFFGTHLPAVGNIGVEADMQKVMTWWCGIIGVTDPVSIQMATGAAAALSLLFVVFLSWAMVASLMH